MRIGAVFSTRDKIIVDVIRDAIETQVKWHFSFDELLKALEGETYDWIIASISAPFQENRNIQKTLERLAKKANLILFAKEPLIEIENIHWLVGKQFTIKEIKGQIKTIISETTLVKMTVIPPVETLPASEINSKAEAAEIIFAQPKQPGVLLAIGQEDIENRIEAELDIMPLFRKTSDMEELKRLLEKTHPSQVEAVILSVRLPGAGLQETINQILSKGIKLIFLAGDVDPEETWIISLQNKGVKTIFDPIKITDILEAIKEPEPASTKTQNIEGILNKFSKNIPVRRNKIPAKLPEDSSIHENYLEAIKEIDWYSTTVSPAKDSIKAIPKTKEPLSAAIQKLPKVIAVSSFTKGGGASKLVLSLDSYLVDRGKVFVIDENLSKDLTKETLAELLSTAKVNASYILIDCSSFQDTLQYRSFLEASDLILWNYIDDSIAPDEARQVWAERIKLFSSLKARHREVIAFHGMVDTQLIEEVFLVPTVKLNGYKDAQGIEKLITNIDNLPAQRTTRVLVSGYDEDENVIFKKDNALYDIVFNPDEASDWIEKHYYDEAIINPNARGAALLEYDLRRKGVRVRKDFQKK